MYKLRDTSASKHFSGIESLEVEVRLPKLETVITPDVYFLVGGRFTAYCLSLAASPDSFALLSKCRLKPHFSGVFRSILCSGGKKMKKESLGEGNVSSGSPGRSWLPPRKVASARRSSGRGRPVPDFVPDDLPIADEDVMPMEPKESGSRSS